MWLHFQNDGVLSFDKHMMLLITKKILLFSPFLKLTANKKSQFELVKKLDGAIQGYAIAEELPVAEKWVWV